MKYRHPATSLISVLCLAGTLASAQNVPGINITGVEGDLATNIRSHVRFGNETCQSSLTRLLRLTPQVRRNVEDALHALGYYNASFTTEFQMEESCWTLRVDVDRGEPVRLDTVDIQILGDASVQSVFRQVITNSVVRPGRQLHHGEYEALKNQISAVAVERGFFAARFLRSEVRVDTSTNQAQVLIEFEPGDRFRFGEVSIDTRDSLSDDFVRSMIPFQPGDAYASDELVELRRNLDRGQYFRQISINPRLAEAQNQVVPVEINLEPFVRRSYTAGVGFTTDTGPRLRLAYLDRYLNASGHRLDGNTSLSRVRSELNANYILPLEGSLRQRLNFSSGLITESNAAFDSNRFKMEAAYRTETDAEWLLNYFINFQLDQFQVGVQEDTTHLTILGADVSKTRADNLINPTRGWKLFGQIRGSTDTVFSDTSFLQLYSTAKYVMPLGQRGRVLFKGELGTTWVNDEQELPVSVRFFAGGDQTIRGYQYQSLGPLNELGQVVGGRHLLVGGAEYDFQFRPGWRVATFYDSGNAFNDPGNFRLRHSVGLGIRWISPIGPIRFDVAKGLRDVAGIRLHVTMGPDL